MALVGAVLVLGWTGFVNTRVVLLALDNFQLSLHQEFFSAGARAHQRGHQRSLIVGGKGRVALPRDVVDGIDCLFIHELVRLGRLDATERLLVIVLTYSGFILALQVAQIFIILRHCPGAAHKNRAVSVLPCLLIAVDSVGIVLVADTHLAVLVRLAVPAKASTPAVLGLILLAMLVIVSVVAVRQRDLLDLLVVQLARHSLNQQLHFLVIYALLVCDFAVELGDSLFWLLGLGDAVCSHSLLVEGSLAKLAHVFLFWLALCSLHTELGVRQLVGFELGGLSLVRGLRLLDRNQ